MAEYLEPSKKQEIFAKYGKSNTDTGSPESQVALFSYRIAHLTEHVKKNKKDVVTRRSLLRLVGKRRQVLDYLQRPSFEDSTLFMDSVHLNEKGARVFSDAMANDIISLGLISN